MIRKVGHRFSDQIMPNTQRRPRQTQIARSSLTAPRTKTRRLSCGGDLQQAYFRSILPRALAWCGSAGAHEMVPNASIIVGPYRRRASLTGFVTIDGQRRC